MTALRPYLPLAIAILLNAAANVLLKLGAVTDPPTTAGATFVQRVLGLLGSATLAAIVLFGLNILFYRKALERIPLSVAYPVILSGSLIIATLGARFVPSLHEAIAPRQLVGIAVIIVGVWLVTRG